MILQRYILRDLIQTFIFTFAALIAICLVGTMFQVIRNYEGAGLMVIVRVLPLAFGYVAMWALLAAVTMATTLVYGRLSADNEINAMRSCGIHTNQILAPAVLFGIAVCICAWVLNIEVVPYARHARRLVFREATLEALRMPPPGEQNLILGKIRLSYLDYRNGRMERPSLMQFEGDRVVMEYFAPSGYIRADKHSITLVMSKPRYRQISPKGVEQTFSAESDVALPLELEDLSKVERRLEDRSMEELREDLDRTKDPTRRSSLLITLQTRFAASATPLLLVLVAVPIGMFVKRGSRLAGLGAALPPLLVYFVTFFIFQGLGERGRVHPVIAAWAPDAFLALLSAFLMGMIHRK